MIGISVYRSLAVPLLLVSAAAIASIPTAVRAQIAVIGSDAAIPTLDPHRANGTPAIRVIDALYDPLVREDLTVVSNSAQPLIGGLAESWTISPDGLTYRFKLRPGVKFHDGTELDAEAVQLSFARMLDTASPVYDERAASNMRFTLRWVASTAAAEPMVFEIKLKSPFSGFLRALSDRRLAVISATALKSMKPDEIGLRPAGTGPFTIASFRQGQNIEMKRNEQFWGKKPAVSSLIFRVIPDPTSLAVAVQTGQVHVLPSASPEQVAQLSTEKSLQIQYPEPPNVFYYRLNLRGKYTDNKLFRQALNYAVNRDNIAILMNKQVKPIGNPVPIGNEVSSEGLPSYSYDPQKAKQLLSQAGITTPIELTFMAPANGPGFSQAPQMMSLVQQDLEAVGIKMKIQLLEWTTWLNTEGPGYKPELNGSLTGWTTGTDAGYWFERMFSGQQMPPAGVNRGWYANATVDDLFNRARAEQDDKKRSDLYREAAKLITDDAPWLFLYQDRAPRVLSSRISGIKGARSVLLDYPNMAIK